MRAHFASCAFLCDLSFIIQTRNSGVGMGETDRETYSKPSKSERKTAVTIRKESDWNGANHQSFMNPFCVQASFSSPTKENKTE